MKLFSIASFKNKSASNAVWYPSGKPGDFLWRENRPVSACWGEPQIPHNAPLVRLHILRTLSFCDYRSCDFSLCFFRLNAQNQIDIGLNRQKFFHFVLRPMILRVCRFLFRNELCTYDCNKASRDKEKFLRGHGREIILFESVARECKRPGTVPLPATERMQAEWTGSTQGWSC